MNIQSPTLTDGKETTFFLQRPLWLVRVLNYEYWPFQLLFFPSVFYWLILAIRARTFVYFTATNPAIELGGFFGESKMNILSNVSDRYKPQTILVEATDSADQILQKVIMKGITFPFICKPDKGEMGFMVKKINNSQELEEYLTFCPGEILVQEFVDYTHELGILYYRYPSGKTGISSVVEKEFMAVVGDGHSSVEELMKQNDRSRFQIKRFRKEKTALLSVVPLTGQKVLLEPVGNHCKGTRFINGEKLINEKLVAVFDEIASTMNGFYFGRFDLKVKTLDDLYQGKNIKILEVNGTTSEPAHIYGEGMTLWKAYTAIFHNMKIVNDIAIENHRKGEKYMAISDVIKTIVQHFKMKRKYGK